MVTGECSLGATERRFADDRSLQAPPRGHANAGHGGGSVAAGPNRARRQHGMANPKPGTPNLAIGQQQDKQTARAGQQMALIIVLHAVTTSLLVPRCSHLLPKPEVMQRPAFGHAAAFATAVRLPRTVGLVTAARQSGAYSTWYTLASGVSGRIGWYLGRGGRTGMTAAPAAGPGLRGSPRALLKTAFRFPRFRTPS